MSRHRVTFTRGPSSGPSWHWVPVSPGLEALAVPTGHVRVALEPDGVYMITAYTKRLGHLELGHCDDLETAQARAQVWATGQGAEHLQRWNAADTWRMEAASDAQLERLRGQRVPISPFGYTKGRAADLSLIAEVTYCHLLHDFLASRPASSPS